MLVLTRKQNETIRIGDDIVITLVRTKGKTVRLGIEAPQQMRIMRGEIASPARVEPLASNGVAAACQESVAEPRRDRSFAESRATASRPHRSGQGVWSASPALETGAWPAAACPTSATC